MFQIVPLNRSTGQFGVYRRTTLVFRGTLDACISYRKGL